MTLQQLYSLLADYKPIILLVMLFAPWVAWGICIAVPGKKEEPFVLSCNLVMATISLLLTVGYMWYVTSTGGDIPRSEEHTSELQSPVPISYAVFCLKKKKKHKNP